MNTDDANDDNLDGLLEKFEKLMADNKAKDAKIEELEDRIAALEDHAVSPQPDEKKKDKIKLVNRLNYICGRIEGRSTITADVFNDIKKLTTDNDDEEDKVVKGRRVKILNAYKKMWTAITSEESNIEYDEDTWTQVLNKIESIVGIVDKQSAADKILEA